MILDYVSNTSGLPFEQQVSQNFTSELQWSSALQISFVLSGSLQIHYNNHTRDFQTHDIFFFPPFETYSIISSTPSTRVLSLKIDFEYIACLCPDVRHLTLQRNHINCDLSDPLYCSLCRDFSTIIFNNLKNEISSRLKLLQAANHIIITLFDSYGTRTDAPFLQNYSGKRIAEILSYINSNYMNKLTVSDIASSLGIHPQYFSTFFQKNFHVSFVEYLNTFRINHSLEELIYTEHSILEIALAHGFSSHKTYAAAFRKLYEVSPTEYRKEIRLQQSNPGGLTKDTPSQDDGIFSYFRQFLQTDNLTSATPNTFQHQHTLSFDTFELKKTARQNRQERFLSLGRAYACLRSEIQEQIKTIKKDYNFDYLRIRDIFSDDLYIYYEKENNESLYSWASLDNVFDFILSIGAKPFPEIGYMPSQLASKKQYANWQYRPNVSHPKSLSKWKELITTFLLHYIDRYGLEELRSWYFDFWTGPDLKIHDPYWNENMEAFFRFYQVTYEAFHEVDPELRLGSPNFSSIDGFPWYDAFLQFCNENDMKPAYISAHLYGCEGHFSKDLKRNANNYSITDQLLLQKQVETIQQIMDKHGFHFTDIIVSDWNLTFLPTDLVRDTCYMGPYICHTINKTMFQVKGLSFWSLSDNYEDFFPDSRLFQGGAGLMDFHSLKKAAYNALSLVGMLGSQLFSRGDNYIFTKEGGEYQLLLYNLPKFDYMYSIIDPSVIDETHRYNIYSNVENLLFRITIQLPAGTYYIKKYEVSREYGSSYDIWGRIGFPPVLTKDMEDYIRESSIPHISYSYQDIKQVLLLDETVPAHGVTLLKIIPK